MAYTETALYCDSVAYAAVAQWAASTAYTVGQIRRQLAAPAVANERCFICVVAGTSGASEPNWAINASFKGNKVTDNTVTWQECTAHPSLNGDSSNVAVWKTAAGTIAIGTVIKNTAGTHFFITTTSGSGTNTEPTWNTTTGATTVDGSNTWTCIGAISSFTTRWAAPAARLQHLLNNNSSWQLNAGMTFYVGDDHNEAMASATSITPSSACQVLCVDHTVALPPGSSDLRTTAVVTFPTSNCFWNNAFNGYVYGLQIKFTASSGFIAQGLGNARVTFEQCLLSITSGTASLRLILGDNSNIGGLTEFKGCVFNTTIASQSLSISGPLRMENCSLTGSFGGSANQIFSGEARFTTFTAEGCDFATNVSSGANLVGTGFSAPYGYFLFKDCKIPPDLTAIYRGGDAGMGNLVIELTRCDSGTGIYRNERHSADGTETTSTSVVRTGGASDGATPVAHQISTNANTNNYARIFNAVPFVVWNATTGTNRTVTVYGIANDIRVPNNDECWCDVEYLGSSASPKGSFARGRALPLATAAALTADTSAWDGAATARANGTAYVVGDARKAASNPGRVFFCTAAGTSAASEPTAIAAGSATFNSSDLSSMTLSGGNLTATASASGGGVRSNAGQAAGKFYFEVLFNTVHANDMTGIALRGAAFGPFNSNATGGIGVNGALGGMYRNGLGLGTNIGAMTSGHRYCFAVDLINQLFWARLDNGNWNNNAGANPATAIGGFDLSSVFGSNAAFAIYVGGVSGVNATANFGGSAFTYAAPSGFSAGPAQGGYATAVDGDAIADGTATFRAGCRFKQALTMGVADVATLNPADKSSNVVLSGGNLTANISSAASNQNVRSTYAQASGKLYFEVTVTAYFPNNGQCCGIAAGSLAITSNLNTASSYAIFNSAGLDLRVNGTNVGTLAAVTTGDKVCVAVDLVNSMIWYRINGGNWNANVSANPATNVGGFSIAASFPANAAYAFVGFGTTGQTSTINFGAAAFAQTVPSGFVSWNTGVFATVPPAQAGYIYTFPKLGRASTAYLLDPLPVLG